MHQSMPRRMRAAFVSVLIPALLLLVLAGAQHTTRAQTSQPSQTSQTSQGRTPTQTVGEFYKALRERRFRDAFALSIYKPAIDGLSAEEVAELQPEFEKLAGAVPEKIEFGGEQISGDTATVFARIGGESAGTPEVIPLIRNSDGQWIFGDRENQDIVRRDGKEFFLKARIETHHKEVEALLLKLANAQALYAAQHGGQFADMNALLQSKLSLREDVESARTLGYQFQITPGKDGKSYKINAEPVRYGHTGNLSYYMDQAGIQKKDTGGKSYNPSGKK